MPVYFIRAGEDGPVKIGVATNVDERLKLLQCGNHETLSVIKVIDGWGPAERQLHKHYADGHLRGEWFLFCESMLDIEHRLLIDVSADNPWADKSPIMQAVFSRCQPSDLARRIKVTLQAVAQWKRVPPARVYDVSDITGIPVHELRPDIFREPEDAA